MARLEALTAEVLGKEAALFVPSGTMAKQIAILCHTSPGDEIIVGEGSHCAYYESGAAPAWAGVQIQQVGQGGLFVGTDVEAAIKPRAYYCPNTSMVVIENTHNRAGGRLFPQDDALGIAEVAKAHDLRLHLDGARLWNAAAASDSSPAELSAPFDSVAVCFSKGLGAPVGSAICGSQAIIDKALRFRKMLGGGMRQAGILAAGALYALENNVQRIADDHAAAAKLASSLAAIEGVVVGSVETNIVNAEVPCPAESVVALAKEKGVLFNPVGPRTLRLVTHLDVVGTSFETCVTQTADAFRTAIANA
jgi:threonine aldolase